MRLANMVNDQLPSPNAAEPNALFMHPVIS